MEGGREDSEPGWGPKRGRQNGHKQSRLCQDLNPDLPDSKCRVLTITPQNHTLLCPVEGDSWPKCPWEGTEEVPAANPGHQGPQHGLTQQPGTQTPAVAGEDAGSWQGMLQSIDLWVLGPARCRCATLLPQGLLLNPARDRAAGSLGHSPVGGTNQGLLQMPIYE